MLSLFRWTDLREDFKEVLTDLFCVIAVGLADEPDCIRQKDVALTGLYPAEGCGPYSISNRDFFVTMNTIS